MKNLKKDNVVGESFFEVDSLVEANRLMSEGVYCYYGLRDNLIVLKVRTGGRKIAVVGTYFFEVDSLVEANRLMSDGLVSCGLRYGFYLFHQRTRGK